MSRYIFQKAQEPFEPGKERKRGVWDVVKKGGAVKVMVSCPSCGILLVLEVHDIDVKGSVSPSVGCSCGFHQWIQLQDWVPEWPTTSSK